MSLPEPSPSAPFAPLGRLVRGGHVESRHLGMVAVVTPDGRSIARTGDPRIPTFLRSAAKPFQALPLLLAGGLEAFDLEPADLALMAASHSGGPEHVARSRSLLERGGFRVEDLLCGAHEPLGKPEAERLREQGGEPTPLHNNCSGKHAGMLLACRLLGLPTADYVSPEHPLQRRILEHLARAAGVEAGAIGLGIDGCSVPAFHLPVAAAARAYAHLADPEAGARSGALGEDEARALGQVAAAMGAVPEMVAGQGRFTTRIMEVTGGRVVAKEGAEGFYGVAVRGPTALGVALKVVDGGERCRDGAVIQVLRLMGALSGAEVEALEEFHRPVLRNHRGLEVGRLEPDLELLPGDGAGVDAEAG